MGERSLEPTDAKEAHLAGLVRTPGSAGILLDVDGTLSPIVRRPELAELIVGAEAALARLVARYRVVAVISGRTRAELAELVRVAGVRLIGTYGLEGAKVPGSVVAAVEDAVDGLEGAWVEVKGISVAAHHREVGDAQAVARLESRLRALAEREGMDLVFGKRVVELVPGGQPLKEAAIERIVREESLGAALYAGDDLADLRAFDALDRMRAAGRLRLTLKVAARGPETPNELVAAADIVVEGPRGIVELLGRL